MAYCRGKYLLAFAAQLSILCAEDHAHTIAAGRAKLKAKTFRLGNEKLVRDLK